MTFQVLPKHIGFIMDGNGRWATKQGLARLEGHRKGVKVVGKMVSAALEANIPYVTFYAFSIENWKRAEKEISGLMALMRQYFKYELEKLHKKGVKIQFIGRRGQASQLPEDILNLMDDVEQKTSKNKSLTAIFAIDYSSRDELNRAAEAYKMGEVSNLQEGLDTAEMPDLDLIIRTSGEQRLSNFMLWQAAYAEFMFTNVSWPDFTVDELRKMLDTFAKRDRRFGAVKIV